MEVGRLEFLLRNGGEALVSDVMGIFLGKSQERMNAIREAVEGRDAQATEAAAHALRSSAIQVGFADLGGICFELERLAAKNEMGSTDGLLEALNLAFEADKAAYLAWRENRKGEGTAPEPGA